MEEVKKLNDLMKKLQCNRIENISVSKIDLETLFSLFNLTNTSVITLNDIKQAKMLTNRLHPDKSHLPPIYFIFFKKVFLIILELYEDTRKMDIQTTIENSKYNCDDHDNEMNNDFVKDAQKDDTFNKSFNNFYEENYIKVQDTKNNWFYESTKIDNFGQNDNLGQKDNLGIEERILKIKEEQKEQRKKANTDIILHTKIQSHNQGFSGTELYNTEENGYLSSNSSSLMYDDIRRVHRDETVFVVDQRDHKKENELSFDALENVRKNGDLNPMSKEESETYFDNTENFRRDIYNRNKLKEINDTKINSTISQQFMSRFMNIL